MPQAAQQTCHSAAYALVAAERQAEYLGRTLYQGQKRRDVQLGPSLMLGPAPLYPQQQGNRAPDCPGRAGSLAHGKHSGNHSEGRGGGWLHVHCLGGCHLAAADRAADRVGRPAGPKHALLLGRVSEVGLGPQGEGFGVGAGPQGKGVVVARGGGPQGKGFGVGVGPQGKGFGVEMVVGPQAS